MSPDEFDATIARMYETAPVLADTDGFVTRIEQRLDRSGRLRGLFISAAGVLGGAIAVREGLRIDLFVGSSSGPVTIAEAAEPVRAVRTDLMDAMSSVIGAVDTGLLTSGGSSSTHLLLFTGVLLVVATTLGALTLSREI